MPPAPTTIPSLPNGGLNPAYATIQTPTAPQSFWDRVSTWASENKALVYTIAGVAVVVTGAGAVYYFADSSAKGDTEQRRASKKERRKAKAEAKAKEQEPLLREAKESEKQPKVEAEKEAEPLPEVTEAIAATLSVEQKTDYAQKLKAAGNEAYKKKNYDQAIELYGKAILCKQDPIFYSNRAACYNAQSQWQKCVDDTTAALSIDAEYVKALKRRANAYEHLEQNSEALLDYTASCIIDSFRNQTSTDSVERLLKKVAETKAKALQEKRGKKLPSPTFVTNYLQSFRKKPAPAGLEESAQLEVGTGKYHLQQGLAQLAKRTGDGYVDAATSFEKAVDAGGLDEHEAFAYNMRGTFFYLRGENELALKDLSKSIELAPGFTQSYIKRASMHLETGDKDAAANDFEKALEHDSEDPDVYYHRAQLHFILGEFSEAAKDYQKSIDLDREFIFSHIQLGVTQYKMGSVASSMATFRRCIKSFDDVPDVYNYYGELLLDQQKYEEAVTKFETAVKKEKQKEGMNVLPLINKALAIFQWKQDFKQAEELCEEALKIDPECDIAVATMAQLLLQQGKVTDALVYFQRAADLARTEGEIVNALSYAEATRTQLEVQEKYPQLAEKLQAASAMGGGRPGMM